MKLIWQNEHYPDVVRGGGGAVNTFYIVRELQQLGHDPLILARGDRDSSAAREEYRGTPVLRIPPPRLPERLWPIWPLLEARYAAPGLALLTGPYDGFVAIDHAFALAVKRIHPDRPLVYRIESIARSHAASVAATAPSRSFAARKRAWVERAMVAENEWVDRRVWARADALVVKSEFMKRELERLYGLATARLHVIPNGVDHTRYSGITPGTRVLEEIGNADRAKIVISFCGRLVRMKNVPLLLAAFARMKSRACCVLVIVGDGDERAALERTAGELGIDDAVRFVGKTDRLEEYLAASDISVLPSTYEPFGNVLLEAMAAGVPCVALEPDDVTIRTASKEIIEDGRTGLFVPGGDPEPLARALDGLVGSPELRKTLGQQAQAACRARYSWKACAAAYADLLMNAPNRREGRGGP